MKVNTKVIAWVFGGLTLIFITTAIVTFCIERHFYRQQLNRSGRNVAVSLNLSLSQPLFQNDRKLLNELVNTVFKQEALDLVEVRTPQGLLLASQCGVVQSQHAPHWFVSLIQWPASLQSMNVLYAQNIVGELVVSADPGYAYDALWSSFIALFYWFLFWSVVMCGATQIGMTRLLSPLQRIIKQTRALGRRQFLMDNQIAGLVEFKQVTTAMNETVQALKKTFQEQLLSMESVRFQIFRDHLTGYGNRRYFLYQLSSLFYREANYVPGFIIGISIDEFLTSEYQDNDRQTNQLLQDIVSLSVEFWQNYPDLIIARYDNAYFTLIIQENQVDYMTKQCETFNQKLKQLVAKQSVYKVLFALVSYDAYHDKSTLLNELEQTLNRAKSEPNQYALSHSVESHPMQHVALDELDNLFSQESEYVEQQCVSNGETILHQDIVLKIPLNDQLINSAYIMPLARRGGLARQLDLFLLDQVCDKEWLEIGPVAFLLSDVTLSDDRILESFIVKIRTLNEKSRANLNIEVSEQTILNHLAQAVTFFRALNELGVRTGVTQAGIYYAGMDYLHELPLAYMKLHGSLSHQEDGDRGFVLRYLTEMVRSLGIPLIATEVQNDREWHFLEQFGVQWGSGDYFNIQKA